jgi:hypothetical protein
VDPLAVVNALVDLTHIDGVDVVDLDRAGPVGRQ